MHALAHTMLHIVELLFFFFSSSCRKEAMVGLLKTSAETHRRPFPFPSLDMILTQSTECRVALPPEIRAAKRNGGDPSGK